jgi:hypothetical protein
MCSTSLTLDNGLTSFPKRKTYAVPLLLSISSHMRHLAVVAKRNACCSLPSHGLSGNGATTV